MAQSVGFEPMISNCTCWKLSSNSTDCASNCFKSYSAAYTKRKYAKWTILNQFTQISQRNMHLTKNYCKLNNFLQKKPYNFCLKLFGICAFTQNSC